MKLTPYSYSWPAIRYPRQICGSSKHWQGYCRKCLTVKDKRSGAPKETILELFWPSLCQACHGLISSWNWSCSTAGTVRDLRLRCTSHLPSEPEACFDDAMPIATVFKGGRAMRSNNGLKKEEVLAL
jgi:hypothetical protein